MTSEINYTEDESGQEQVSWRNCYSIVTLLRVLQMLTKKRAHRIVMLMQYKATVFFIILDFIGGFEKSLEARIKALTAIRTKGLQEHNPIYRPKIQKQ